MPRPLTACIRCKKRRIQCDQSRPACERCKLQRVPCPGYLSNLPTKLRFVVALHNKSDKSGDRRTFKTINPSIKLNERHVRRAALFDRFLRFYLPEGRDGSTSHFAFLGLLPHISQAPLLETSIDVLCLTMTGSVYGEKTGLFAARVEYGKALPMLASEIGRLHSVDAGRTPHDHVLAAILILALSDLFDALAHGRQGSQGWSQHTEGVTAYLRAIGPEVVSKFPRLGQCVYHSIRQMLFCRSLVQRKSPFLASRRWMNATEQSSKRDSYIALYDMVIQIPSLLQDNEGMKLSKYMRLCKDICQLRSHLESWRQQKLSSRSGEDYDQVAIEQMAHFALQCRDRTFQRVYNFPSVEEGSQYQLYLVSCFFLDGRLAGLVNELSKRNVSPQSLNGFSLSSTDLDCDTYDSAIKLCKALPFCCEPRNLSAGRIGIRLVKILRDYFQHRDYKKEGEWCKIVANLLQQSGSPTDGIILEEKGKAMNRGSHFWKFWTSHEPLVLPQEADGDNINL